MGHFAQPAQWQSWAYSGVSDPFATYSQMPAYPSYLAESMEAYQAHHQRLMNQHISRSTESKPRLSKGEVELLEAEFQKNHKPNSITKKALAESMRVDNARINNWFQNRRAREKKEKNIREYEAKQKLEKDKADADGTSLAEERKRDLVASSAPFPRPPSSTVSHLSTDSPESDSLDDTVLDGAKAIDAEEVAASIETTPDLISEATFAKADSHRGGADHSPDDVPDYLSISDASGDGIALSDSELYMPLGNSKSPGDVLADYQSMMMQPAVAKASQFFSSPMFLGGLQTEQSFQGISLSDRDVSISPTSQVPTGLHLKSPPPIDIASRRNRRPTPLSIGASRTCGSGIKTAIDLSKMTDSSSFMRRTSSASSGSSRVTKAVATPRNMFSINRSPTSTGQASSIAPPTPDTPIVANQTGLDGQAINSAFGVDHKMAAFHHDPTLSTPPSTPGVMDGMFNINSAYGMTLSDDGIVNTGLSGLPSSFDMARLPAFLTGNAAAQTQAMYDAQARQAYMALYSDTGDWPHAGLRG